MYFQLVFCAWLLVYIISCGAIPQNQALRLTSFEFRKENFKFLFSILLSAIRSCNVGDSILLFGIGKLSYMQRSKRTSGAIVRLIISLVSPRLLNHQLVGHQPSGLLFVKDMRVLHEGYKSVYRVFILRSGFNTGQVSNFLGAKSKSPHRVSQTL